MNSVIYIFILVSSTWIQPINPTRCFSCIDTELQTDIPCGQSDIDLMPVVECGQKGLCLYYKVLRGGYFEGDFAYFQ